MQSLPPPLAWVAPFCESTGRALDEGLSWNLKPVNPLETQVTIRWSNNLSPKLYLGVWNLFQMWATNNDSVPQGKPLHGTSSIAVNVAVKRRLGRPMASHPMG